MLLKKILVIPFLFLPLLALPANWPVVEGDFPDGAKILYQCQGQFEGNIPFVFQTPDGKGYRGTLTCGKEI